MAPPLSSFEVLSFDCYGTLIDWETGIWSQLEGPAATAGVSRSQALSAYARLESQLEHEHPSLPYRRILSLVHARLMEELGVPESEGHSERFGESVGSWPPFPDSREALQALGSRYKLVILSNVDQRSFAGSQRQLGARFDAIYTAEDIGTYKPDPANFDYLLEHVSADFGVGAEGLLHVAQSMFHDHVPAKAAGLSTAWIDRQRLSEGGDWGATAVVDDPPVPDYTFFTLRELADAAAS